MIIVTLKNVKDAIARIAEAEGIAPAKLPHRIPRRRQALTRLKSRPKTATLITTNSSPWWRGWP